MFQAGGQASESEYGLREELSRSAVERFAVAQVFREHAKPINSIDFHRSGELLVSSGSDEQLVFSNVVAGVVRRVIPVRKYGCGPVRFTSDSVQPTLLVASAKTGSDDAVRSLDPSACEYVRSFAGHAGRVSSLAPSPSSPPVFLSSSLDLSVRLWDSRRREAVGVVKAPGTPSVAFDPKGLVFGVAFQDHSGTQVKLYDARSYEEGPFVEFPIDSGNADPTCFEFSPDGEHFLVASKEVGNAIRIFDAYEGNHRRSFARPATRGCATLCARFSPDAKFVMTGSEDHGLCIWDMASSDNVLEAKEKHALPVTSCAWNPVYGVIASACQNVVMWLPEPAGGDNSGS